MRKKQILKFILLSILSIYLIYETVYSYKISDPWGLTFAIVTIPFAILSIISIYNTIKTFKSIIKNNETDTKGRTFKRTYIVPIMVVLILALITTGITMYNFYSPSKSDKIPENYIAVFNGGAGEITYSTYIYKINNGQDNYGFKYINTTNRTTSWGSSNWNIEITSKGTVSWTQDVFAIAEKNNAYSYVELPNDDKTYTIDEYKAIFSLK